MVTSSNRQEEKAPACKHKIRWAFFLYNFSQFVITLCSSCVQVTPSSPVKSQRTGTDATITMDVSWTDSSNQQPVGQHDLYMLAVDKSIIMLEGHNDVDPARVSSFTNLIIFGWSVFVYLRMTVELLYKNLKYLYIVWKKKAVYKEVYMQR